MFLFSQSFLHQQQLQTVANVGNRVEWVDSPVTAAVGNAEGRHRVGVVWLATLNDNAMEISREKETRVFEDLVQNLVWAEFGAALSAGE